MKKVTDFKIGEKEYSLVLNNRGLASMERSLGRSILSIFGVPPKELIQNMTIDVLAAAAKYGVEKIGNEDPYDFIDRFCEEGGTIDDFTGIVLMAISNTGLFTRGKAAKPATRTRAKTTAKP